MAGFQFDLGTGAIAAGNLVGGEASGPAQIGPASASGNLGVNSPGFINREAPDVDNRTLDALIDISQGLMDDSIARKQDEMFLKGVARAAQGEAVKDIVAEQPVWGSMFGKSSTAKGALAFEKMKVVNDRMVDVQDRMSEFRTYSPAEFEQHIAGSIDEWRTGDTDVDMAVQSHWLEQLPRVYGIQAKEHYQYVQETNYNNKRASADSLATLLQTYGRAEIDGKMSAEDLELARFRAVQEVFTIPADMDAKFRSAYLMDTMTKQMSESKHHLVAGMFKYGKPLLDQYLTVDDQVKLQAARDTYEKKTIEEFGSLHFAESVGVMKGRAAAGTISPADIAEQTKQTNADFRRRYGIERDYITSDELTSLVSGTTAAGIRAARERALQDRGLRLENEQKAARQQQIQQRIVAGQATMAIAAGERAADVELSGAQIFDMQLMGKGGLPAAIETLHSNFASTRWVNGQLKDRFTQGFNTALQSGYSGASFDDTYKMWKAMGQTGGSLMAAAYFGPDAHEGLTIYESILPRQGPELAFAQAFGVRQPSNVRVQRETREAVVEATADMGDPSLYAKHFNGVYPMGEQAQAYLSAEVAARVQRRHDNFGGPIAEIAKDELAQATLRNDVAGGFVMSRAPNQRPLTERLGVTGEELGDTVNYALAIAMSKSGLPTNAHPNYTMLKNRIPTAAFHKLWGGAKFLDGEDVKISAVRGQDVNGEANLVFNVYRSNGESKIIRISEKQLVEAHSEVRGFKKTK